PVAAVPGSETVGRAGQVGTRGRRQPPDRAAAVRCQRIAGRTGCEIEGFPLSVARMKCNGIRALVPDSTTFHPGYLGSLQPPPPCANPPPVPQMLLRAIACRAC